MRGIHDDENFMLTTTRAARRITSPSSTAGKATVPQTGERVPG
jgi:hypothetical protein